MSSPQEETPAYSITGHPTPAELAALMAALATIGSATAVLARVDRRWGRAPRGWIAAGRAAMTEG